VYFGRAYCLFLYPGKLLLVSGMQPRNIKAPNKTGKQLLQINQKSRLKKTDLREHLTMNDLNRVGMFGRAG